MLGDKRRYLGLFDDIVVEGVEVGVGVRNRGGDAVESAVFEKLHLVGDGQVSHSHLLGCAF